MRLFLISGPSGGGKSTFIHLMRTSALPPALGERLGWGDRDWDVRDWPVFDITNDMRRKLETIGPAAVWAELGARDCAILHYDIISVVRSGLKGYTSDPAFRLIGPGDELQIAFVQPAPEQLFQQFTLRDQARLKAKPRGAQIWNGRVLPAWRMVVESLGGPGRPEQRLYSNGQLVDALYGRWLAFAGELARTHGGRPLIAVAPCADAHGRPSFELVPSAGTSTPSPSGMH